MYVDTDSERLMLRLVNEPFNYRKYAAVDTHFGCVFPASLSFPENSRGEEKKSLRTLLLRPLSGSTHGAQRSSWRDSQLARGRERRARAARKHPGVIHCRTTAFRCLRVRVITMAVLVWSRLRPRPVHAGRNAARVRRPVSAEDQQGPQNTSTVLPLVHLLIRQPTITRLTFPLPPTDVRKPEAPGDLATGFHADLGQISLPAAATR